MGNLPLFPEQASTFAPEVDHLLVFPAGGVGLLHRADFRRDLLSSPSATAAARSANCRRVIHGGMTLEIVWSVIPFGLTMVMFIWGADLFFRESRPPDNATADLRGRQAVDVEAAAHGGPARDQRTAHSRRPPRQADHDLAKT